MRAPEFWQRRGPAGPRPGAAGDGLWRKRGVESALARPYHAAIPVICAGNLTAGGSGKTPIAIAIAETLSARSLKPFFLTRGYGGRETGPMLVTEHSNAEHVGDEALLLARIAPAIVARDRAAGAALAAATGASAIVMDDGHQNFSLRKDLSLVVVDGQTGFGNGLMIPAGPLREPVAQGLARADAVIVMGDGAPDLQGFSRPVLRAYLRAQSDAFRGQKVFAFAGIGRPEKFIASLKESSAQITGTRFFPDHHPYRADEIATLREAAGDALLVTTEKDLVRLSPDQRGGIAVLPVHAQFDDPAALGRLLDSLTPGV